MPKIQIEGFVVSLFFKIKQMGFNARFFDLVNGRMNSNINDGLVRNAVNISKSAVNPKSWQAIRSGRL